MSSFEQEFSNLRIPLEDILQATSNFAAGYLIRKGSLGDVYHGELLQPEGIVMCVFKRLNRAIGAGNPEFWKEVIMLSRYRHENIVSLVGFCNEHGEQVLVYEFQTYGSLDKYLSYSKLMWFKRLQICLDAAQGLNYLHNNPGQGVIHSGIKSSNILLDKNWQAKLDDLGLSKLITSSNQKYAFLSSGTIGYVDPLYVETGILTTEFDIYSFGVVLFEVLRGRLATTPDEEIGRFLGKLAPQHYKEGALTEIIDPLLRKQMNPTSIKVFSTIACRCLVADQSQRATIIEVVKELKYALDFQVNTTTKRN